MVNILPSPLVSIDQTTIKPGIYDISNEIYHQGSGISRSALMEFKKSPYHYWYKYLNPYYVPESATPAQIFGNALHTFILEPKEFEKQFFTLDKFDKRTKAGAERWKQIQAEQGIKTFLKEAQYQELQQMADSLQKNKLALQLIESAQIEQSLYWNDPETGILCKCRPDILQRNFVCDLKSAQDGSAWAFSKAVLDYGYHIQAAMIREALLHIQKIKIDDFFFIVVEKAEPFVTVVYQLDKKSIDKGRDEFKSLLQAYKQCLETDNWPSYRAQEISLPRYAFN
ncbi:PD-(D/E)XK nuclease-like domain-containing protein [Rickettsiella massiliensis]|uniref:PD-(D/E)XK nuclease-like domain-containing protein n=1 Tax=Rickettsiella massiliensis TaxID=676517 RepID=UPI00029A81CA|nr:PD-(D/E)XK nuclease-like domain-containing protein [Rickettsiella massiliensis]